MSQAHHDCLIELGTEELPPTALRGLEQALAAGIHGGLEKANLSHGAIHSFATPRRLAVLIKRLASQQPALDIRRRGPPVKAGFDAAGQPTRAALAFAESCGVTVEGLQKIDEGKGAFLYFIGARPGSPLPELLPGIVQGALDALPIPRRMRWGAGTAEFVRPVHWLVMIHGREIIPATLLGVAAGNETRGHRFHAPKPLRIGSPATYERMLHERGFVIADFAARRAQIYEKVTMAATELGGRALCSDALLDEVTALVEWPVPVAGRFEQRFLTLPREVLISTLQDHQRYFPIEDAEGNLIAGFAAVSNIESREPAKVREGNERVVRPRLADAAFFWERDRKQPLATRRVALDAMTFQARLGTLGDKTRRLHTLAPELASALGTPPGAVERAADLCKCDLLTAMVGEFPELQGIMGAYYALADGEDPEVAAAIREHYLPRAAGDVLPQSAAGTALALADRLDTLAGIFEINEKPTGTKDPFGLRRAAIAILRILIEKRLELDLPGFIALALRGVREDVSRLKSASGEQSEAFRVTTDGPDPPSRAEVSRLSLTEVAQRAPELADRPQSPNAQSPATHSEDDAVAAQIYDFIMERLRAYCLERAPAPVPAGAAAITTEMFDAVLATKPRSPLDFDARLQALSAFLEMPEAVSLAASNKRIANILRKAPEATGEAVNVEDLREPAEVRLFDAMESLREPVAAAIAQREYSNALGRLAQLRPPVDAFFDQVLVMDEDRKLRANRLTLLAQLHGLFTGIADLSRLPG